MDSKYNVVTIGSATRDVLLNAAEFKIIKTSEVATGEALCLPVGSKLEVKKIVLTSGGGGTNAAVTFARQNLKTACVGVVGNDANGKAILAELEQEGVDVSLFQSHSDNMTAYSVVLVQDSGERTILSYKGEGQHFAAAQVPFDSLQSDWVYLNSLGGHYDLLENAVAWAAKNNVKIATNPGTKELEHGLEKLKPLLSAVAIVTMNQEEAAGLLGKDFNDLESIFAEMDKIVPGIFVMTRGHDGVMVSDGKNRYSAGVPDSPIVERTGSGDAFASGFVAEYIRSGDIIKAIQFGTANASSVVTQYGGKAGILKKDDWGPWPLIEVSKQ
ncbi:carbohydrate kinase family protein [Candidatus Parcubacteria bacterium]|nr:carbohydrate kinase family protein [Candidatus Parcubacteria bacterium]